MLTHEHDWFTLHIPIIATILRGHLGFITILHFMAFHDYISFERFCNITVPSVDVTDLEKHLTHNFTKVIISLLDIIKESLYYEPRIRRRRDLLLFVIQRSGRITNEERNKLLNTQTTRYSSIGWRHTLKNQRCCKASFCQKYYSIYYVGYVYKGITLKSYYLRKYVHVLYSGVCDEKII